MDLLAITSYFNPFHGKLRKKNYETFRKHLGIPLLTVEWSPEARFELGEEDADYLIQVSGGDLLWQKERLLNIGIAKARELGVLNVAFLDCDIVFANPSWHRQVISGLESCPVIQCYTHINYLPLIDHVGMSREALTSFPPQLTRLSLAYELMQFDCLLAQQTIEDHLQPKPSFKSRTGNPGMAVAARLDEQSCWKHYEGNIVGGGDSVLMAAVVDQLDDLFLTRTFSPAHQENIRNWRTKNLPAKISLGFANNQIAHLWHGDLDKRRYVERHAILVDCDYDPARDLDSAQHGALRFAKEKTRIKTEVTEYLISRDDA